MSHDGPQTDPACQAAGLLTRRREEAHPLGCGSEEWRSETCGGSDKPHSVAVSMRPRAAKEAQRFRKVTEVEGRK
jgi:hypothetical protein